MTPPTKSPRPGGPPRPLTVGGDDGWRHWLTCRLPLPVPQEEENGAEEEEEETAEDGEEEDEGDEEGGEGRGTVRAGLKN